MSDVNNRTAPAAVTPRLFRSLAVGVLGLNLLILLAAIGLQLVQPGPAALLLIVGQTLAVAAAAASLALLGSRPLAYAALPLIVALTLVIAVYALLLPALAASIIAALTLVVIVAALTGSRRLTTLAAALALASGLLVALLGPRLGFDLGTELLLGPLSMVGPLFIVGLLWYAADRLLAARDAAILLAERRAAEAEAARREAEAARVQAEQRADEQARLLTLVESLELPVLGVGPGVLAVPLIGNLDARRLDAIQDAVLAAVSRERAHTVIFDLTGIGEIDSAVARGLIDMARAVKLLGANTLISGLRASVAQTLAGLGLTLEGFRPVGNLQEALLSIRS
jgi:rsbT co-antagonist protein RsbR